MTKLKPKMTALAACLLIAFTVVVSCKKDSKTTAAESAELTQQKLSTLLDRMSEISDGSKDAEIRLAFESLDARELEIFQQLKLKRDSLDVAAEFKGDQVQITARLNYIKDLRNEFSAKAIRQHGIAYNKLNKAQLSELNITIDKEHAALAKSTYGKQDIGIMACPQFNYIEAAAQQKNVPGGVGAYAYYSGDNNPVWYMPCDYEFRFDGQYRFVRGDNYETRQVLEAYGGYISRRFMWFSDGWDTGLLLGEATVYRHASGPGNIRIGMHNVY